MDKKDNINWDVRRYKIAKAMLPSIHQTNVEIAMGTGKASSREECVLLAIEYADIMIDKLKGK